MKVPDAAVLIPIIIEDGEHSILFERRADDLAYQPGDVCFPGGAMEPYETAKDAVVRETTEELLIRTDQITDLKEIGPRRGPYGRTVTVFTGGLSDYNFTFSRSETAEVFSVPISWFLKQETDDSDYPEYYFKKYRIWGFTARCVREYIDGIRKGN